MLLVCLIVAVIVGIVYARVAAVIDTVGRSKVKCLNLKMPLV